jgi:hypothetical protein
VGMDHLLSKEKRGERVFCLVLSIQKDARKRSMLKTG